MRALILVAALACGGCAAATAAVERVKTAASYAITISDAVCPLADPAVMPTVAKACAALAPLVPLIRDILPPKVEDGA